MKKVAAILSKTFLGRSSGMKKLPTIRVIEVLKPCSIWAFYTNMVSALIKNSHEPLLITLKQSTLAQNLGLYRLGLCYLEGTGTTKNITKGLQALHEADEHNIPEASIELALYYEIANPTLAFSLHEKAALSDLPMAHYNLGLCYSEGVITPYHYKNAKKWLQSAKNLEHELAESALAELEKKQKQKRKKRRTRRR